MLFRVLAASLALASLLPTGCQADAPPPVTVTLPTAEPSGIPTNDCIPLTYYPADRGEAASSPAVILIHPLGVSHNRHMHRFARYLARHGMAGAVITLPYHLDRRPPGEFPAQSLWSPDPERVARAASQCAADVSAVVTWLGRRPEVDPRRIGVIGVSLGAMIAHLAMGRDERLSAGVAILGGGDLPRLRRRSVLFDKRLQRRQEAIGKDPAASLRPVDPLTYAGQNRPRRVLMIQAARDLFVPPHNARVLWEALGRPPIRWLDTNHFGPALAAPSLMRASLAYLRAAWQSSRGEAISPPRIYAPTLKLGLVSGLDSAVTGALQWQVLSFARRRDHMSLLHLDLGWSGRGPFAGLAITLGGFVDLGMARRFTGRAIRPYVSLHVVF